MSNTLQITMVLICGESGRYTSFFPQFPTIIANGDTEKEAEENLLEMIQLVFEHEDKWPNRTDDPAGNFAYTTNKFNLTITEA